MAFIHEIRSLRQYMKDIDVTVLKSMQEKLKLWLILLIIHTYGLKVRIVIVCMHGSVLHCGVGTTG
jgi:hypothetical protein